MATEDQKKNLIQLIRNNPGVKANQLIADYMENFYRGRDQQTDSSDDPKDVPNLLEQLVKDGDIVEVEYVTPDMSYRAKSVYFPKGITIRIM